MLLRVEQEMDASNKRRVMHSVCFNSRQSLYNYLKGYLLLHEVKPGEPTSLAGLLEKCKRLDQRFETISLAPVHCRDAIHHRDLCRDRGEVEKCWEVALAARQIVKSHFEKT